MDESVKVPVIAHIYVENTRNGEYRRELTQEQYEVFQRIKGGKERSEYVHSLDNEVTE